MIKWIWNVKNYNIWIRQILSIVHTRLPSISNLWKSFFGWLTFWIEDFIVFFCSRNILIKSIVFQIVSAAYNCLPLLWTTVENNWNIKKIFFSDKVFIVNWTSNFLQRNFVGQPLSIEILAANPYLLKFRRHTIIYRSFVGQPLSVEISSANLNL